jgi:transcriptional regulator of met regulon
MIELLDFLGSFSNPSTVQCLPAESSLRRSLSPHIPLLSKSILHKKGIKEEARRRKSFGAREGIAERTCEW